MDSSFGALDAIAFVVFAVLIFVRLVLATGNEQADRRLVHR